jgi:hypothetical protein
MILTGENRSTQRNSIANTTLSTTNPTWSSLGSAPRLRGQAGNPRGMLMLFIETFRHTVKTMCKNVLVSAFNMTVHMEIQSSVWDSLDVSILWGGGSKLNDVIPWAPAKFLCRLIMRDLSVAPFKTSIVRVFMLNTLSPIVTTVRKNYMGWNLVIWFW